ncbi:hypothetical protein VPH35_005878 [Triticum aestivum]
MQLDADMARFYLVGWNVGVGPMASYTRAISVGRQVLAYHVQYTIVPEIITQLVDKRYLLVAGNLQWPTEPYSFTSDCGLPSPKWTRSQWLILTTSHEAYNKSKSEGEQVISILSDGQVVVLIIFAMQQSADHNIIRQESNEYWHHIHSQVAAFTSDELIHQWAAQGILPCMAIKEEDEETSTINNKCSIMHRLGRVILEAFQKYSLLQLPFSPADEAYEATNSGAQFLPYHGLIAKVITCDELFDNKKKWISFVGDHGYHVSREWLSPEETKGATALILKGCSDQSPILSKLGHFLPKLCYLRVLDLSYTPIKAVPSSIGCLQNLRLLSVRGCHDLKTLSSSSTTNATDSSTIIGSSSPLSTLYKLEFLDMNGVPVSHLTQDVANQKSNLIHLDMSHSEISTFPPNFFHDMSNLEELILTSCSNLVDLPPSMASLSSLTTLEIFEEMQKLQSLKLIDNNKLISLTGPISGFQIIKLEGHPNSVSFMLIGTPHIRRLSLRGCRKLESVEIKDVGSLEEIDLSGTGGVPFLRRFPWHKLERLPEVFYLDHCSEENLNHPNQDSQVCVTDPRFFHSFCNTVVDFIRDGQFLQSFYVRVAPCITNSMPLQDEEAILHIKLQELVQKQSTYLDVHCSCYVEEIAIASPITVPLNRTERHVEITGTQSAIDGLLYLLSVTKSISVSCDTAINYFPAEINFHELEECELRWCHKMEGVVYATKGMKKLRNMHVCNLKRLVWFCLEYKDCPRLEHVVPHTATLPCLKTLDIMFCYKLKTIFISNYKENDTYQLPSLQRIHLQELPLLQHFHDKDATITTPVCLRHLPHLQGRQPETVKVNGERSWWSKLRWLSPLHLDSYDPKLPREFSSFDEHSDMSIYLR